MTDSAVEAPAAAPRRPGKRERLVGAAMQLLHQQGAERTTLADIAKMADVPPGNVYYYFKAKDDVIAAAIGAHAQQVRTALAAIDARHLALDLLAAYEGSALLANTMRDPAILSGVARRLNHWIDTL